MSRFTFLDRESISPESAAASAGAKDDTGAHDVDGAQLLQVGVRELLDRIENRHCAIGRSRASR